MSTPNWSRLERERNASAQKLYDSRLRVGDELASEDELPITAEWLEASGATFVFRYWRWPGEDLMLRQRALRNCWIAVIGGVTLGFTPTTRGQIDRLRRALKGEV